MMGGKRHTLPTADGATPSLPDTRRFRTSKIRWVQAQTRRRGRFHLVAPGHRLSERTSGDGRVSGWRRGARGGSGGGGNGRPVCGVTPRVEGGCARTFGGVIFDGTRISPPAGGRTPLGQLLGAQRPLLVRLKRQTQTSHWRRMDAKRRKLLEPSPATGGQFVDHAKTELGRNVGRTAPEVAEQWVERGR